VTNPIGQHAHASESNANPHTRPMAMPPPESVAPMSRRTTKPGSAIKAAPVAASIVAAMNVILLVVT
jgi:hypothetical protein